MPTDTGGIIRPIGYNFRGEQDENLVTEDSFIVDQPFLIIMNKPLPKYSKLYMEITIRDHPDNPKIRYLPIYLGVHKEPSFGILNADFCLGNIYYTTWTDNIDFDIMERYDAAGRVTHTAQHDTEWKIPIVDTVIGIGVDFPANKIEIFSDGNLFYSFTPKTWTLNNQPDNIYFAIHGQFYEHLEGFINVGRYKTEYLPDGYWTLYDQYYGKLNGICDLPITFLCEGNEDWLWVDTLLPIEMDIENDIAPLDPGTHKRSLFLIHKYPDHMTFEDNETHGFNIISKYNPLNGLDIPSTSSDITSPNLPIPNDAKVYFELHVAEGVMNENILGIPISIGISDEMNVLTGKSVRINLWHEKYKRYKVYRYNNGVETEEDAGEILTPSTPTQPNTVGVLYDLGNNQMTITVEGNIFTVVDLSKDGMVFNDVGGLYYAFIKCEDYAFTGNAYGICDFGEEGEDSVEYTLDTENGEMTLYYYYNGFIKFPSDPTYLDIVFNTLPWKINHKKYFPITFVVAGSESEEEKRFSPGLNKLFDTYNVVTDVEDHMNEPQMPIFDFEEEVKEDLEDNNRTVTVTGELMINFTTLMGGDLNLIDLIFGYSDFSMDILRGTISSYDRSAYNYDLDCIIGNYIDYDINLIDLRFDEEKVLNKDIDSSLNINKLSINNRFIDGQITIQAREELNVDINGQVIIEDDSDISQLQFTPTEEFYHKMNLGANENGTWYGNGVEADYNFTDVATVKVSNIPDSFKGKLDTILDLDDIRTSNTFGEEGYNVFAGSESRMVDSVEYDKENEQLIFTLNMGCYSWVDSSNPEYLYGYINIQITSTDGYTFYIPLKYTFYYQKSQGTIETGSATSHTDKDVPNELNPNIKYYTMNGQEQDTITIYSQLNRVEFPEGFEFHSEYAEFNLLSWGKNTAWTTSPYNYPITNVVLNSQTPVVFEDGVWKSSINVTITADQLYTGDEDGYLSMEWTYYDEENFIKLNVNTGGLTVYLK